MSLSRTGTALALLIFAVIFLWSGITYLGKPRADAFRLSPALTAAQDIPVITVRHSVDGSTHRYYGQIEMPACDLLSTATQAVGPDTARFVIQLEFMHPADCTDTSTTTNAFVIAFDAENPTSAPRLDGVLLNRAVASIEIVEDGI